MSRTVKIIGGFAAVGFTLPLIMLAYYEIFRTPAGEFFFWACPTCIASMALDNATTSTGVIVWLLISLSNAVLYAVPGAIVAFVVNFRRSNSTHTMSS